MKTRSETLFDPLSFARRGPGRREHLTPTQIAQIERTVGRTPEVMVKVLPKGTNSLQSVKNHIGYIGRRGKVELTCDDDEKLQGKGVADQLVADWDLELDSLRGKSDLTASSKKSAPKLVHKVLFSMPPGTDPGKVLAAVKNLCREEFALRHRYSMALHTDGPHPHIHVLVKAMSEQGERLHIRKETLRRWRLEFARHLRALGVPANATQRYIRGEVSPRMLDGIYRANRRGDSSHVRARVDSVASELLKGGLRAEPASRNLRETRDKLVGGWRAIAELLSAQRHTTLAAEVHRYIDKLPIPRTGKERIADELVGRIRTCSNREVAVTRRTEVVR
jgi:hypothetical protein